MASEAEQAAKVILNELDAYLAARERLARAGDNPFAHADAAGYLNAQRRELLGAITHAIKEARDG